jgi:hypothetical protein
LLNSDIVVMIEKVGMTISSGVGDISALSIGD